MTPIRTTKKLHQRVFCLSWLASVAFSKHRRSAESGQKSLTMQENWSHEEFLATVMQRASCRTRIGGSSMRIRTAHFPAVKTIENLNLDHLPSLRRDVLAHLATSTYIPKAENVILLGPPGIGKAHPAIGLGVKATQSGYSVLFDIADSWIARLSAAHHTGKPEAD